MPSASSSDETTPASIFHSQESTPDENGQWPLSTISAIDLPGPAGRKDEGRRDQRVGILVPDRVLSARVEHAQHPVVAGEVGEIPRHGSVGLPQRIGAIDQRDIIELGAADAFWLHDPEQTGVVQIALGLRRQAPQLLGLGSALAQLGISARARATMAA